MPRPPRVQYPDAFYHVFDRGVRWESIFLEESDYARFETFMLEAADHCGIDLHDWSLIPNHFHLLIKTPRGNLAQFMQMFLTRYASYFNRKYKTVGHVFQGRYGARLCDMEDYFLALVRYVELNPYKVSDDHLLAKPGGWKWTALRFLMGVELMPKTCEKALLATLRRFGATPDQARKRLAQFLADGLKKGGWEDFYVPGKLGFLGDEIFEAEVDRCVGRGPDRAGKERHVDPAQLVALAAECFAIPPDALASRSEERSLGRVRQAIVLVGCKELGHPTAPLARLLGRRPSAIVSILQRSRKKVPEVEIETLRRALPPSAGAWPRAAVRAVS